MVKPLGDILENLPSNLLMIWFIHVLELQRTYHWLQSSNSFSAFYLDLFNWEEKEIVLYIISLDKSDSEIIALMN